MSGGIDQPRWVRSASAIWRRTLDATLVLGDTGVVSLEGSARTLWEVLDRPGSAAELARDLAALHGVDVGGVRPGVDAALDDLRTAGLLTSTTSADRLVASSPAPRGLVSGTAFADNPAAAIAAWGLGPWVSLPDLEHAGWEATATAIERERLTGLAVGALAAGDLDVRDPVHRAQLADLHRHSMLVAMRLERLLVETTDALRSVGIDPIVLKGPSIAHTAYDDPSLRPFGDIDLLVPSEQLDAAFAALVALGHTRRYSEPRPGFDRRFGKGGAFLVDGGLEIDVHRTFAAGPFGLTVDLDEAHRGTGHVTVGGRDVRTLGAPQEVVAIAMHAALGTRWPRLLNLRDVVQLLTSATIDADEVVRVAERWRVDAALARAVQLAAATFHLGDDLPLSSWARTHAPSRRQRRALEAYTGSSRGYSSQAIAALSVIPGVRPRLTYLRAMLFPDRSYERWRGERRVGRLRRIIRSTVAERR